MQEDFSKQTLDAVAQAIFDKKGFNILALDVRGISTLTDYFFIAEGNIDRHITAIAASIKNRLAEQEVYPLHVEGKTAGNWLVLDYGDLVVHLFTSEARETYALEELWKEAKIVDVKIDASTK